MRNPFPLAAETAHGIVAAVNVATRVDAGLGVDYGRLHLASAWRRLRRHDPPFEARIGGFDLRFSSYGDLFLLVHEIFVERCYDVSLMRPELIVDAGANIGLATLRFAREHPDALIMAIEPDPRTFALLERNVSANGLEDRVELHQVALDDVDGVGELLADSLAGGVHTALSTARGESTGAITFAVPTRRLSTLLAGRRVDYLKLDIEGREDALLRELEESATLERIGRVTCEVHLSPARPFVLDEIVDLLERHSFCVDVARTGLPGTALARATTPP